MRENVLVHPWIICLVLQNCKITRIDLNLKKFCALLFFSINWKIPWKRPLLQWAEKFRENVSYLKAAVSSFVSSSNLVQQTIKFSAFMQLSVKVFRILLYLESKSIALASSSSSRSNSSSSSNSSFGSSRFSHSSLRSWKN